MVWKENFNGCRLDTTKWSRIGPGNVDWNRHMSKHDSCFELRNGKLILKGIVNTVDPTDARPFITGGVTTEGKFSFTYGKIEIRAKLGRAQGAWPAFWMLGDRIKTIGWPACGEIDIMEHLNHERQVYQTVHSHYTQVLKQTRSPLSGSTVPVRRDKYNVYGLEWYPDKLIWTINGKETFSYSRIDADASGQWPFDKPFYLLIDMQLGGNWVEPVDLEELPVEMAVDWIKISQLR